MTIIPHIQNVQSKKTVLVIGGAGFIGSQLCESLLEQYNVLCVDNYFSGSEGSIDALLSHPHFEFIRHDIIQPLDFAALTGVERFQVEHTGVVAIFYCAFSSAPATITAHPLEMMRAASEGVRNALELARKYNAKFLLVSDALSYGDALTGTPSEVVQGAVSRRDLAPHIESMRFAETLLEQYRAQYSLEGSVIRLGETYGPHMRFDDGRFISSAIAAALDGQSIAVPASFTQGAFLFTADAIDAIIKIWQEAPSGTYNVGSGVLYRVSEVLEKIGALTASPGLMSTTESPTVAQELWAIQSLPIAIDHIREILGWFPVVLLEEGLAKAIDDMKARKKIKTFI